MVPAEYQHRLQHRCAWYRWPTLRSSAGEAELYVREVQEEQLRARLS